MGWKDKIDGGASYSRKWWWPLVSTEIRFLFFIEFAVVLIGAIVAGGLIWCSKGFTTLSDGFEFARLLITAMIAVGGGYGLILASRRSAKFSEQVDTGQKQADTTQKQLFNEQLGRGAELLANGEIVMRQTGIRVLADLAERAISEPRQVKLIMSIIHDFVHANASSPSEDKERLDIAIGIRTLGYLYNEVDKSDDSGGFRKLLSFSSCHLEGLGFKNAELQEANFQSAKLQGANFRGANLQRANFIGAKLERAIFRGAKLERAIFRGANLQGANFIGAKLERARFYLAKLQGANFSGAELQRANFTEVESQEMDFTEAKLQKANLRDAQLQGANFKVAQLQGADFKGAKLQNVNFDSAKLEWAYSTGVDFSSAKNLTEAQVKEMIFEVNLPPRLPEDLENSLDLKRRYELKEDPNNKSIHYRCFVESDAEWSGKRVDEWVNQYITSIRDSEDAS